MYKKLIFVVAIMAMCVGCGVFPVKTETRINDISGSWAYPQISYLVNEGIMRGYPDSSFKPNNPITMVEFITIVNRTFKFETIGRVSFSDVNRWNWYYKDVGRAEAAGYLPDDHTSSLEPNNYITREEAAYIIATVLKLDISETETLPLKDLYSVSSQKRSSVLAVIEAGYMRGDSDGTFRPLDPITRAEAAVIMTKCIRSDALRTLKTNVKDFGAKGDGQTDDTEAIQSAINYVHSTGGTSVFIPEGVYLIDPDISIKPQDNIQLRLDDEAILKAKPTDNGNYVVVRIEDVVNVEIVGGNIVGERYEHLGRSGEWGMGISILGSQNIRINDISVSDCWGDGIYIAGSKISAYSQNIRIERFKLQGNRRQGISVISAIDLTIKDGMISDTSGTRPQSGLDLEPDNTNEFLQGILIENLLTINNAGYGIECWFGCGTTNALQLPVEKVSITIENHIDHNSRGGTLHNIPYYIGEGYDIKVR